MVCEVCFRSGRAINADELQLKVNERQPADAPPAKALPAQAPPAQAAPAQAQPAEPQPSSGPPPPVDVSDMAKELEDLKAKHGAGSRLEACLLELDEQRRATVSVVSELDQVKRELASAVSRAEEAEAAVAARP